MKYFLFATKRFVLLLALTLLSPFVMAVEIAERDAGIYVILQPDGASTGMFYRLSKRGEKWVIEGKESDNSWKNISCDKGCDYRKTTIAEIETYFPMDVRVNADIACIQNVAQAFCRYSPKDIPANVEYVVLGLATSKPTLIFIQRLTSQ